MHRALRPLRRCWSSSAAAKGCTDDVVLLRGAPRAAASRRRRPAAASPAARPRAAFAPGRPPPLVVPFALSEDEARAAFLAWQRRSWLAPRGLLAPGTFSLRPALLPFWAFDVRARVEGGAGGAGEERRFSWDDPATQVYASFRLRRDHAAAAQLPAGAAAAAAAPLDAAAARAGALASPRLAAPAPLDAPAMPRGLAWEFALRRLRAREAAAAAAAPGAAPGEPPPLPRLVPLSARARLLYLPAFELSYVLGETHNVHGERRPARFAALVAGAAPELARGPAAAGERHFSAARAAVAAGGAVAVAGAAVAARDPAALAAALEAALPAAAVAAAAAAAAARAAPVLLRGRAEDARVAAEDAETEAAVALGLGPADAGGATQEAILSGLEWRRWEAADARAWDEGKRARWAAQLWAAQRRRRRERAALRARLAAGAARREAEAAREARRAARWGRSAHGAGAAAREAAFGRAGGRADFLGHYEALGLAGGAGASQEDVKRAFRAAALRWHPDRAAGGGAGERRRARERFHRARAAYEVLRDPARRRRYDAGESGVP
jgi:hypothetical protein